MPGLSIRHHDAGERWCVVSVDGEIDLASAPTLKSALASLLSEGYRDFVLDLSQVRLMDSTGISVLVGIRRRLEPDGRLYLAGVRAELADVFRIAGIASRFAMVSTVEEALASRHRRTGEGALRLGRDAEIVVGIASTALPFADTEAAEAEQWLRILHDLGSAGHVLSAAGVQREPVRPREAGREPEPPTGSAEDRIAAVLEQARLAASDRRTSAVETSDVLVGVMDVYGEDFNRILELHGSSRAAVAAQLGVGPRDG